MSYLFWWQVDLGRMVPVKEVYCYLGTSYHPNPVVRVGKVAKNIDFYFLVFSADKEKKLIHLHFHERFSFLFSCKPW